MKKSASSGTREDAVSGDWEAGSPEDRPAWARPQCDALKVGARQGQGRALPAPVA